jgi:hypothetical protein
MSMTVARPKPVGRNHPNYTGALQFAAQLVEEVWPTCKGNPNSIDEQLFSQYLVRGNPK